MGRHVQIERVGLGNGGSIGYVGRQLGDIVAGGCDGMRGAEHRQTPADEYGCGEDHGAVDLKEGKRGR